MENSIISKDLPQTQHVRQDLGALPTMVLQGPRSPCSKASKNAISRWVRLEDKGESEGEWEWEGGGGREVGSSWERKRKREKEGWKFPLVPFYKLWIIAKREKEGSNNFSFHSLQNTTLELFLCRFWNSKKLILEFQNSYWSFATRTPNLNPETSSFGIPYQVLELEPRNPLITTSGFEICNQILEPNTLGSWLDSLAFFSSPLLFIPWNLGYHLQSC